MTGYLDSSRPFPYCPGCGHPHILRDLDAALGRLELPHERVVLVTDIGCVGLADALFPRVHTVHTLHGRSVAVAAGLQMGEREAPQQPLKPVVLIGDGGVGIGMLHLVHAAQLNVDVTVLVHNNLIYGMTGGQHSVMTPPGLKTTTTPEGCPIPPLDLSALLSGAGAGFFARTAAPGEDVVTIVSEAIAHPGFACVEIFELCPAFATRVGGMSGKDLRALPEDRGLPLGILQRSTDRPAFAGSAAERPEEPAGIAPRPSLGTLDDTARVVVAGSAGERVQSAALLAAAAAAAAGLQATVRTDNPVTQGRGFSLAEITIAPGPIDYTGLVDPDLVIVTSEEGALQLRARGLLDPPGSARRYVLEQQLEPPEGLVAASSALRDRFGSRQAALGCLMEEIDRAGWWSRDAWGAAIDSLPPLRQREARALLSALA
ncbi:MAG: thiamine pyrophosphate-dependent enzyme [Planctomycetota bacterium]